ncbi:bifunctional adenosylcobinamide kinase/adenosylcobinamide-phosphate guanylyltransferase [Tepidanaerobacter sp. GT38]|uniref:bifunctional adenosylcobinamide kinase/adenosylcobinamide-phosphate guanylyltransferase n=1 Tax=Tepidanaerobacter sp. GT38 TaxID=2722793 RepID=UPI001F013382|nr:bifunctional adenosylcobinamide kinase/adenosylcobinamide-phosphate guanylyltransferase [Tepidanaerobacter sp. GT38]MCG1012013.1 bifunctional adenosylcobinamide kinase/adenosylcobinamide-phosphate guanylyltransferase [Tepidanaerobacter sp. GT38]
MKATFVTGGARSGKSRFAEKMALETGQNVIYIATAQALDEEMAHRIKIHRQRRPENWTTVEEPRYLSRALKEIEQEKKYNGFPIVLIDCLALLVSNWLPLEKASDLSLWDNLRVDLLTEIDAMISQMKRMEKDFIIVSNEVGLGLVPEYPLGRLYRDLLGEVNQKVAAFADEVIFMVSGLPMKLK